MAILWKAGYDGGADYAGAVLGTVGKDVRIMSDVWAWVTYARVWDGAAVKLVPVSNSEFGAHGTVVADATPAVLAAVAAFEAAAAVAAEKARVAATVDYEIAVAMKVAVGKDVTVVKGRKVKVGSAGRVFWMGDGRYGMRVGIELTDGNRVFTALSNLAVTNPDDYLDVPALMARLAA
jgi:hypothetical protein